MNMRVLTFFYLSYNRFVDIDECFDPDNNPCNGTCTNLPGSFTCSCPHGYEGDARKDGRGCIAHNSKSVALKLSLGEKIHALVTDNYVSNWNDSKEY